MTGAGEAVTDLYRLRKLLTKRTADIERAVAGSGCTAKNVIGAGTYLLDLEGDVSLLSARQRELVERFIRPLLDEPWR